MGYGEEAWCEMRWNDMRWSGMIWYEMMKNERAEGRRARRTKAFITKTRTSESGWKTKKDNSLSSLGKTFHAMYEMLRVVAHLQSHEKSQITLGCPCNEAEERLMPNPHRGLRRILNQLKQSWTKCHNDQWLILQIQNGTTYIWDGNPLDIYGGSGKTTLVKIAPVVVSSMPGKEILRRADLCASWARKKRNSQCGARTCHAFVSDQRLKRKCGQREGCCA